MPRLRQLHLPSLIAIAVALAWSLGYLALGEKPFGEEFGRALEKRAAEGREPRWDQDAALGLYAAAGANAAICLALLAAAPLWAKRRAEPADAPPAPAASGGRGGGWRLAAGIGAAMVAAIAIRAPLASKSLWWDELWQLKQASHGQWDLEEDPPRFEPSTWARAAWYYQKPTNHAPMALAQMASLKTWRALTGAPAEAFSEIPARAPALLATLAGCAGLALLLRAWGFAAGPAVAAAFAYALHPWAIRYGVDARGYAIAAPALIWAMLGLTRALAAPGKAWGGWWLFAAGQFALLWAQPNALWACAGLALGAGAYLVRARAWQGARMPGIGFLIAFNAIAAMAFLQLWLPNLIQATRWVGGEEIGHALDWRLLFEAGAQMLAGMDRGASAAAPLTLSYYLGGPVSFLAIAAAACTALFGAWHLAKTKSARPGVALALGVIACAALYLGVTAARGDYFFHRFLFPLCPLVCAALAAAFSISGKARLPARIAAGFAIAAAWFVPWHLLAARPFAPMKEVAALIQREPDAIAVGYGLGGRIMQVYEPRVRWALSAEDLNQAIADATQRGKPLIVFVGYEDLNRQNHPDGFALLDDDRIFQQVAFFDGIEPQFTFRVFRRHPGRADEK